MSVWLRRLAVLALLGFPVAVLGSRLGLFEWGAGFKMVAASLVLAALVFLLSLVAMFRQRNSDPAGFSLARTAAILSLLPLLGIGAQIIKGRSLPPIHNISTDTVDPPQFARITELRTEQHNPLEYDTEVLAEQQLKAYPEIKTLMTGEAPDQAYQRTLAVVEQLGWTIVSSDQAAGVIEATETTGMWAFKDDVVIRIRAGGSGSSIDLRSVSRVGRSDLGANAKRIKSFLDAY